MKYGYEKVALCTRGECAHGPSRHKGITRGDNNYRGAQEVGECRNCHCVGYDPTWDERFQTCSICKWSYGRDLDECPHSYEHKPRCGVEFPWGKEMIPCERAYNHWGMHYFQPD